MSEHRCHGAAAQPDYGMVEPHLPFIRAADRPGYDGLVDRSAEGYGGPAGSLAEGYGGPADSLEEGYGGLVGSLAEGYGGPADSLEEGYGGLVGSLAEGYGGLADSLAEGYGGPAESLEEGYGGLADSLAEGYGGPAESLEEGYGGLVAHMAEGYGGPADSLAEGYSGPADSLAEGYADGLPGPVAEEGSREGVAERWVGLADCSDEVVLNILQHVPPHDLLLNVARVSKRLHALSRDKSLVSHVSHISLSEQYKVCDEQVRCLLRCVRPHLLSLDLAGCYWLSSACVSEAWACRQLRRLDVSGCRLPAGRLAKLLSGADQLTELALDVGRGFDLRALSAEGRATLARLRVLTQTLLVPSYGVLPLCPALTRLQLRLEVAGTGMMGTAVGTGMGTACGVELAVGQSSVPHYQSLSCLDARLAPGAANRTLLALLLAPLSVRPITRLRRLLLSAPGPAPQRPPALIGLLDSLGEGLAEEGGDSSTALQLPGSWLDEQGLRRVLSRGCPAYLSLARGGPSPCLPHYDLRPLRSLNLSGCGQELDADWLGALCKSCPLLQHLNLSGMHHHHRGDPGAMATAHPCSILAKLPHLLSLALSVCAVAEGNGTPPSPSETNPLLLGLRKARRVGVETYRPGSEVTETEEGGVSCLRRLLIGCSRLQELELSGAEFVSATPRYEAAIRKQAAGCECARSVGEVAVATLASLGPSLRSLTLAALPGLQTGASLCQLTQQCAHIRTLSLATLGPTHSVCYTHTLLQALAHCQRLRDLRLEQPYFNANSAFFEALGECGALQRLCIVSRNGTFCPVAVTTFMQRSTEVIMCHLFMGGTLVACRTLQKSLMDSLSRPALSVVVFPLLHEDLPQVVREIPLTHLDQVTLYKSRVAQQPAS
ncbi:F-box/LRR-repeat protein 18 [Sardina pilchardus]|uniref:F-box/LRR-repeat protein 18 n=1 Tax=Sardina pilchardus TaxID=27697 RepID=UPI002E162F8B